MMIMLAEGVEDFSLFEIKKNMNSIYFVSVFRMMMRAFQAGNISCELCIWLQYLCCTRIDAGWMR